MADLHDFFNNDLAGDTLVDLGFVYDSEREFGCNFIDLPNDIGHGFRSRALGNRRNGRSCCFAVIFDES